MKDPIKVGLPRHNRVLVIPRVEEPRNPVATASSHDLLLYFCDGPVTEIVVSGRTGGTYRSFNSRRQLVYRIAHRLAEAVQLLFAHSPFQGFTDICAR